MSFIEIATRDQNERRKVVFSSRSALDAQIKE